MEYDLLRIFSNCFRKGGLEDELFIKSTHKYIVKDFKITHLGEILFLHPFKSLFWEKHQILFIADLHLGKAAHFRKSGIPIPEEIHRPDLDRLTYLVQKYRPERLVFLGDLFHSTYNNAWISFKKFCDDAIGFKPDLILGNHDILDPKKYDFLNIHEFPLILEPYIFSHQPLPEEEIEGCFNICGHVHPSVRVSGPARQSLRVACFYFGQKQAILPAFGNFTGTAKIPKQSKEDQFYAVANQKIICLN